MVLKIYLRYWIRYHDLEFLIPIILSYGTKIPTTVIKVTNPTLKSRIHVKTNEFFVVAINNDKCEKDLVLLKILN